MTSSALSRYLAFRRGLPRPRLEHLRVTARGIDFAVCRTPATDDAPPLLCINGGLLFDHKLLWPALAPLASHRQLIFYDQRGRGATSVPPGYHASRIEFDAGDIPALRSALGIAQWDMLGHSWGGGIAMLAAQAEYAARAANHASRPPAVRRLVLVASVGLTSDWLRILHRCALSRLVGAAHQRLAALNPAALATPDLNYHARYANAFFPAWFADQEFAASISAPVGNSSTGAAVAARLRREGYDWRDRLRDLPTPALVVHGTADLLPLSVAEQTAALLAQARVVPIAAAGHNPFWEAPDEFFAAVDSFLRDDTPNHMSTHATPETDLPPQRTL